MLNILEAIKKYRSHLEKANAYGRIIGTALVDALKTIVPDIDFTIGWTEAGVDTICLWSDSHDVQHKKWYKRRYTRLESLIVEIFPELERHVDTPFGVFLDPEEADRARSALEKLRGEKDE